MLNNIIISGRLVRDPSQKATQNGVAVSNFTVAVDRSFAQGGKKETDFFDCVAWRGTAEFVGKHFKKGAWIAVQGRMESRSYQTQAGDNRRVWEVQVDNVHFCGGKDAGQPAGDADDSAFVKQDKPLPKEEQAVLDGMGMPFTVVDNEEDLPF